MEDLQIPSRVASSGGDFIDESDDSASLPPPQFDTSSPTMHAETQFAQLIERLIAEEQDIKNENPQLQQQQQSQQQQQQQQTTFGNTTRNTWPCF